MLSCYLAKNMGTKKSFARVQDSSLKSELDDLNIDQIIYITQEQAESTARELAAKEGIFSGPSSGGTTCGFPTFTAVPPKCSLLLLSTIL